MMYFWLQYTYCTVCSKDSLCLLVCGLCISGQGEVGRVTCRVTWWLLWQVVWNNFCTNVVRKQYFHFVGDLFLAVKVVWAQKGCLLAKECLLLQVCLRVGVIMVTSVCIVVASGLGLSLGVRTWTEMKIWLFECMHILKVVSNKKGGV